LVFKKLEANPVVLKALARSHALHLDMLDMPRLADSVLTSRFTEDEIWYVISALPPDKEPGPDGFMARFLQVAWPIIWSDLM
jgi:hypothetical protein